jgi:hypothetical protein
MFREHEGFIITTDQGTRRPKGVPHKKGQRADRRPVRGDLSAPKLEAAVWLSPRFKGRV